MKKFKYTNKHKKYKKKTIKRDINKQINKSASYTKNMIFEIYNYKTKTQTLKQKYFFRVFLLKITLQFLSAI